MAHYLRGFSDSSFDLFCAIIFIFYDRHPKVAGLVLSLTGGAGILRNGGNAIDGEDVGAYNINIDDDILMGRLGNNQDNNIVDGENIDEFVKLYQDIR